MLESWDSFFVAETAAAAALLGLLFVSVSINLKQIVEVGGLADRALCSLLLLLAILVIGLALSMPGQPLALTGVETCVGAILTGVLTAKFGLRGLKAADAKYRTNFERNVWSNVGALAPILIGGLIMIAGGDSGLYWVGAGVCLTLLKAVVEGWIFLVEINR
jgi:modulator of FtsH protease